MSAYVVVEVEVKDPQLYEEYRRRVPEIIARHGGRYLARGGETRVLEGEWHPRRLVMLEFGSLEGALRWWDSEDYRPLRALRERSARTKLVLIDGVREADLR